MDYKYESNSNKNRREQEEKRENEDNNKRKYNKIVSSKITIKKKNWFQRFVDSIFTSKSGTIKHYIIYDLIIPNVKRGIQETINILLYGSENRGVSVNYNSTRRYTDYARRETPVVYQRNNNYIMDNIILQSRKEAEDVLDTLYDCLQTYNVVRVSDLNDLLGITGTYIDNNYGWSSLEGSTIISRYDGYEIKLPRPIALK